MKRAVALLSCAAVLAACADAPSPVESTAARVAAPGTVPLADEVVGVSLDVPRDWAVLPDPVLFNTYGFALFDPGGPKHGGHARGESLTYNGQPYGGNTVWPNRLRCVSCRASDGGDIYGNGDGQFDVKDSTGAKFYTRFYHGRWMRG